LVFSISLFSSDPILSVLILSVFCLITIMLKIFQVSLAPPGEKSNDWESD